MDINQLKYALAVLKAGSIKKAAGELYVSQPYLSKVIKSLEDELGFPLFFRTSRGVLPTRDGTVFLQKAKKVTQSLSQLESSYKKDFTPVTSISLIKSPFSVTKRQNEGILKQVIDSGDTLTELHVTDGSVSQVIQAVKNGECKIGVLRFLQKNEKAVKSFFSDNQLVVSR